MKLRFQLTVCLITLAMLHTIRGEEQATFTFYKNYSAPIPPEGYVVFYARALGPDNYVVLDLQRKEARIYSPYKETGLLHTHQLTEAEYKRAMALLTSKKALGIPPRSDEAAMDAFEFSAEGIVNQRAIKFHHILPDNSAVLALYDLYKHFRDTNPTN